MSNHQFTFHQNLGCLKLLLFSKCFECFMISACPVLCKSVLSGSKWAPDELVCCFACTNQNFTIKPSESDDSWTVVCSWCQWERLGLPSRPNRQPQTLWRPRFTVCMGCGSLIDRVGSMNYLTVLLFVCCSHPCCLFLPSCFQCSDCGY